MSSPISTADIHFDEAGVIRSRQFNDVYFSAENGLAESRYVFIEGNKLQERWQGTTTDFTIIETGFGTGLNFIAAWQAWQERASTKATLHYHSIEKYPLTVEAMHAALSCWPELESFAASLCKQYSMATLQHGVWRCVMGAVNLSLYMMDVEEALNMVQRGNIHTDAWFLDGFAPRVNPDMWSPLLYKTMEDCTRSGGTCATFTAAGEVRRGIQSSGFQVVKRKGYGKKREMLTGIYHSLDME